MDKPTKHHSVYFTPPSGTTVYGVLGSKGRVKGQTRAAKEKGKKKRVHHTKAGEYVSGWDKQIYPLTPERVAQADRGRANLSLLMRLGDIAPKVIEERRKIELPQAGDRVYYDDSGSIRYGTVKRVGPDLVQMISGTRIPKGQVHLRGRGPTIRNPIIDETLRIHGGIARLPDDIAQTVLDPKRGGFGRRGEGVRWAHDRALAKVDTNELYDRAMAEQLDFISRRGQRGVDTEGGGAVGGVDIEASKRPLLLDRQVSSASEPDSVLSQDLELTPTPRGPTLPIPAAIRHWDDLTDEDIRKWMKENPYWTPPRPEGKTTMFGTEMIMNPSGWDRGRAFEGSR